MFHNELIELAFPIEDFIRIKKEIAAAQHERNAATLAWAKTRTSLSATETASLDLQFKTVFEEIENLSVPAEKLESISQLVQQGASAKLLGNHELESYNLAMFIKHIPAITKKADLDIASQLIRLTIIAGADLNTQKAYAGNGGAYSIEWLSEFLAGTGNGLQNEDQYACCYELLSWLARDHAEHIHPFTLLLACLRKLSPEITYWQQKSILKMIALGYSPVTESIYQSTPLFSRIAAIYVPWLTLIFPFENDLLASYIASVQEQLTEETVAQLVNAFTSNQKARKHFKAFFSLRPHWLLTYIIEKNPSLIFNLVKRNEKELLAPFLKHYKNALINIRDEQGNTLLHQAVLSRVPAEQTMQLLLQSKFSQQAVNAEGLTALDLALRNNKKKLIGLLQ